MSDPSKRALTTAEGKRMFLEPKKIGFDIESAGHSMTLEDSKSLSLKSGTTVDICAVKRIHFYAKKILIRSRGALTLLRDSDNI